MHSTRTAKKRCTHTGDLGVDAFRIFQMPSSLGIHAKGKCGIQADGLFGTSIVKLIAHNSSAAKYIKV